MSARCLEGHGSARASHACIEAVIGRDLLAKGPSSKLLPSCPSLGLMANFHTLPRSMQLWASRKRLVSLDVVSWVCFSDRRRST